jgi:type II secretory pathway pseudopilin PulG
MCASSSSPSQRGMSLVEIAIAVTLFTVVLAGVMETQVASVGYASRAESQDEITTEASRVMDSIARDIASSGWWFADRTLDYKDAGTDRNLRYAPYAQIQDTGSGETSGLGNAFAHAWRDPADIRAFPRVPANLDPYLPGTMADNGLISGALAASAAERQTWDRSFYARSQELILLKASISAWNHTQDTMLPTQDSEPALFFTGTRADWINVESTDAAEEAKRARLRILYSSGWKVLLDGAGNVTGYDPHKVYTYTSNPVNGTALDPATVGDARNIPYGVVMESGILADPDGDLSDIQVNWVTIDGSAYTPTAQAANNLREYMYAVVRSPVGLGRLVRAHKVIEIAPSAARFGVEVGRLLPRDTAATGNFYMQVDQVLSDNIVRAIFDTYRTVDAGATEVTTLDYNTIRVRLFFARLPPAAAPETVMYRIVDRIFTMRSQNSERDKDPQETNSNASLLGTDPIGVRF